MAEFTMAAEITLKANAAIKSIQNFEKGAKNSKREFSLLGRTISLDTKRIKKNMAALAAIAGSFFAGVMSQSPHVRVEFKRLEASTLLLNVAIGEKLQPTVEVIVDAIIILQEAFLSLPDGIQSVIVITGFLTVVLIAATVAAIALWAALGPITLVIVGISLAIALLIVYWDEFLLIMKVSGLIIMAVLTIFWNGLKWVGQAIWDFLILAFQQLGITLVKIGYAIGDFVRDTINSFLGMVNTINTTVMEAFRNMWTNIEKGWSKLANFIGGVFDGIGDAIRWVFDGIMDGIIWVINKAIDVYNTVTGSNKKHIGKGGSDSGRTLAAGDGIASGTSSRGGITAKAEGGDIFQDGLIFAHRKERILTASENRAGGVRGGNQGGSVTINNYNTFKIGSVDSKKRIREMMKESDRMNKRNMDRRFRT